MQNEYTQQLEDTIESLKQKLDEASYFKPVWSQEVVPRVGKMWVLQLQGNPVSGMYEKKIKYYNSGSPKQRSRWAAATVPKEIMATITIQSDGRCMPFIFGREYEWQKSLGECKSYVNRIVFGVDEI